VRYLSIDTPAKISKIGLGTWQFGSREWGYGDQYADRKAAEMVFTQLAKRAVRPLGGGWEHVADLGLAVGDDDAVDEQLGELAPLVEGGGGQPGADGAAECLDAVGDGAELYLLPGGGVQLVLLGE
jgi:hypothetical protein